MDTETLALELFDCIKILKRGPMEKAHALSRGEKSILCHLAFGRDNATPTELSRQFKISTARVANALNSLEKKGFIQRVHSGEDRRVVYVHITETGREAACRGRDSAIASLKDLLTDLGEEDAVAYVRIMKKVVRLIQEKEAQQADEEAEASACVSLTQDS